MVELEILVARERIAVAVTKAALSAIDGAESCVSSVRDSVRHINAAELVPEEVRAVWMRLHAQATDYLDQLRAHRAKLDELLSKLPSK